MATKIVRCFDIWKDEENNNTWDGFEFTKEEAQKAADSLIDCTNCKDCSDCVNCDHCYNCNKCDSCEWCIECKGCENCSYCTSCDDCIECTQCMACQAAKDSEYMNAPTENSLKEEQQCSPFFNDSMFV